MNVRWINSDPQWMFVNHWTELQYLRKLRIGKVKWHAETTKSLNSGSEFKPILNLFRNHLLRPELSRSPPTDHWSCFSQHLCEEDHYRWITKPVCILWDMLPPNLQIWFSLVPMQGPFPIWGPSQKWLIYFWQDRGGEEHLSSVAGGQLATVFPLPCLGRQNNAAVLSTQKANLWWRGGLDQG